LAFSPKNLVSGWQCRQILGGPRYISQAYPKTSRGGEARDPPKDWYGFFWLLKDISRLCLTGDTKQHAGGTWLLYPQEIQHQIIIEKKKRPDPELGRVFDDLLPLYESTMPTEAGETTRLWDRLQEVGFYQLSFELLLSAFLELKGKEACLSALGGLLCYAHPLEWQNRMEHGNASGGFFQRR
jgi:hypothetical protein